MKVLGVDIGTYEVKTVLLDAGLARTQLTAAAAYGVGDGPLEALLTEATRGNFDLVAVSVDRRAVMTRTLTLPFQDPVQLAKVVPFEAESQLPFTAEKGYIDHFVIEAGKPEGTEVLVFAISHKDFEQQRTLWSGVQHPDAVHQVDSFAGVNALLTLGAIPDGTVAVVDLGHSKTCVEILRARRLAFSRCLSNGGESLTRALAVARGLSPADADALTLISSALENNPDIMLSRFDPELSHYDRQGAYGAFDPTAYANVNAACHAGASHGRRRRLGRPRRPALRPPGPTGHAHRQPQARRSAGGGRLGPGPFRHGLRGRAGRRQLHQPPWSAQGTHHRGLSQGGPLVLEVPPAQDLGGGDGHPGARARLRGLAVRRHPAAQVGSGSGRGASQGRAGPGEQGQRDPRPQEDRPGRAGSRRERGATATGTAQAARHQQRRDSQ
ncbi:MAG: pilus assembly protein PilM [Candidatus Riflebacteria bacterium]|nr:pilus assembly protein PilM [Candidatus Riflebacteria bacterium]